MGTGNILSPQGSGEAMSLIVKWLVNILGHLMLLCMEEYFGLNKQAYCTLFNVTITEQFYNCKKKEKKKEHN